MKRLLLFLALSFLLVGSVSAGFGWSDFVLYHTFDDSELSGGVYTDNTTGSGYNCTVVGATTGVAAKKEEGVSFDGTNDHCHSLSAPVSGTAWTINFWLYMEDNAYGGDGTAEYLWTQTNTTQVAGDENDYRLITYIQHPDDVKEEINIVIEEDDGIISSASSGEGRVDSDFVTDSTWHMITFTYDAAGVGTFYVYLDGTDVTNANQTNAETIDFGGNSSFGVYPYIAAYGKFSIDEFFVDDAFYTAANVTSLYNASVGNFPPRGPGTPDTLNISVLNPPNNDHNNSRPLDIILNISTTQPANCSLFVDAILNSTQLGLTSGAHTYQPDLSEGTHKYYFTCNNSIDQTSTTNRTVIMDYTSPIWTFRANNFWAQDNSSVFSVHTTSSLQHNYTLTDTYLFGHEILISAPNGTVIWNYTRTGLTSSQEAFTNTTSIIGLPNGVYKINLSGTDDHTAKSIPDYGYDITSQAITYTPPSGSVITIEAVEGNLNGITTEKEEDRYTFALEWKSARTEHQIDLSCDTELYYRGDLYEWPTFICGQHWVDFVPTGMTMSDFESVTVTKKPSGKYNLNFKTWSNAQTLNFHSIGGLNTMKLNYQFRINNTPAQLENLTAAQRYRDAVYLTWDVKKGTNHTLLYLDGVYSTSTNYTFYNFTALASSTEYTFTAYAANGSNTNWTVSTENNITASTMYNTTILIFAKAAGNLTPLNNVTLSITGPGGYSNTTTFDNNITYTGLQPGSYNLVGRKDGYSDVFDTVIAVNNASVNTTLVFSSSAGNVVFYVRDRYDREIYQATVRITREADGLFVGLKATDLAGTAAFTLNQNTRYNVNITKTGYQPYYRVIEPVLTSYTIYLDETESTRPGLYSGLQTAFYPRSSNLANDTVYAFQFKYNSTLWTITDCSLTLYDNESNVLSSTSPSCTGSMSINQNTGGYPSILSVATLELNNTYTVTFRKQYTVGDYAPTGFTLKDFFDDLRSFGGSGFGGFGRVTLTIFVITFITVMAATKMEWLGDSERVLVFITVLVLIASYLNFLYLPLEMIPFEFVRQYGIFLLLFILTGSVAARNWGVTQ